MKKIIIVKDVNDRKLSYRTRSMLKGLASGVWDGIKFVIVVIVIQIIIDKIKK